MRPNVLRVLTSAFLAFAACCYNAHLFAQTMELGEINLGSIEHIELHGQYAYLGSGFRQLSVFDLADPSQPAEVGSVTLGGGIEEMVFIGDYAYIAADRGGMIVVDVTDPTQPVAVGEVAVGKQIVDIAIEGALAFLHEWREGVTVVDISDIANMQILGSFESHNSAVIQDIAVSGQYFYYQAGSRLSVNDISNPIEPQEIERVSAEGITLELIGDYVYVINNASFSIVDISDPEQPERVSIFSNFTNRFQLMLDFEIADNFAYFSANGDGLVIVDISDPTRPTKLDAIEHGGSWFDGVGASGNLFLASRSSNVTVYQNDFPSSVESAKFGVSPRHAFTIAPNPTAQSAVIAFSLRSPGFATITLHTVDGKFIKRYNDGFLLPGAHKQTLDLDGVPSGAYICTIRTDHERQTAQMVIVR